MSKETEAAKALREVHKTCPCTQEHGTTFRCDNSGFQCCDCCEGEHEEHKSPGVVICTEPLHGAIDKAIRLAREEEAGATKAGMEEVAAQARREGIEAAKEAVSCAIQPCGCDPCNKREALEAISDLLEKNDADEG